MKKSLAVVSAVAVATTLTACSKECEPVIKEVEKVVEKEVIKEVIKEVEVPVEVPAQVDMERNYKPGTYFKATEADENGIVTFATLVVDKYGRISGIHLDNTSVQNQYLYDEENKALYIFVKGVEDVIPDTYRKVTLGKANKTVDDAITSEDLIVGYPYYDQIIATLKPVKANETQGTIDFYSDEENTWSKQMAKLADKIIADQTTYGINLYTSGNAKKTNTVKGVDVAVGKEIDLIQSILDNEAKIGDTVLESLDNKVYGTYKPGTYYNVSAPRVTESGVVYNTSVVVVDEFGQVIGVNLDETISMNGKSTTKSILGEDYKEKDLSFVSQADKLEDAIVRNQGIKGFKYQTLDGKEVVNPFASDKTKLVPTTITNVEGVSLTINNLLETVLKTLDEKAKVELEDGVYTKTDASGNLMTIVVEKGKITGVNLDTLEIKEQAYITIDDKDYELYTYDKGSLDLSLEEMKTPTLIYRDGDTYRHATDQGINKGYEVGDTVKFDYEGYDEKATIKPVVANSTKKALQDRYGMATTEGQLEWYEQAKAYETYVVKNGYNAFNMTDKEKTDSVSGLTIKVNEYNALLNDLVLQAKDQANATKNYVKLDKTQVLGDYKLAKGSYTTTSDVPTKDSGYYLFNMIVTEDSIYVSIDETIKVDDKLTTKRALEDYRVKVDADGELTKSTDKSDPTYAEYVNKLLKDQASNFKFTNGLVDYDYELKSEIKYEKKDGPHELVNGSSENLLGYYNNAMEKALIQALRARVTEAANDIVTQINDAIKDKFIVASNPVTSGQIEVDLSKLLSIGGKDRNEAKFKIELDSNDKFTKVNDDKNGKYFLTAEAEDVLQSTISKFKYTIEFDDYKAVSGEVDVNVMSNTDYKNRFLEAKDAEGKDLSPTLRNTYSNLLTGTMVTLDLSEAAYTKNSLGNLGEVGARDINTALMFRVENLNNVKAQVRELPVLVNGKAATLTRDTEQWSANVALNKGDVITIPTLGMTLTCTLEEGITKDEALGFANNFEIKVYDKTLTSEEKAKFAEGLENVAVKETYPVGTKFEVVAYQEKANENTEIKGEFTVKAFFDAFEQRDTKDGLLSWQKGEPSRDFTFTVLNEKAALREAKQATGAGNLLDTVTTSLSGIKLTTEKDIKIQGVKVKWDLVVDEKDKDVASISDNKLSVTTDSKTHKVTLVANYTKEDGNPLFKDSEESKRQFDFTVKPTSAKEVEINILEQMSIDFLKPILNLDELKDNSVVLGSFNVSHPGVSDVKITWKDNNGKVIPADTSLYNAIMRQTDELAPGKLKDVSFKVEIKYTYNEKEYTLNKTYTSSVYSNLGTSVSENSVTVQFDDSSDQDDVNRGINIAIQYAKKHNINQIVVPKVSVASLDLNNFTGNVVILGNNNPSNNLTLENAGFANVTIEGGSYNQINGGDSAQTLALSENEPTSGKLTLNNVSAKTVNNASYLVVNGKSEIEIIANTVKAGVINYPAKVTTNNATNVKQDFVAVSDGKEFQKALENNKVTNIYLEKDIYTKDSTNVYLDNSDPQKNYPYFEATSSKNIFGNGHKIINDTLTNYNKSLDLLNNGTSDVVYNIKDLTILNTHPSFSGIDLSMSTTTSGNLTVNLENVTLETNNTASDAFSTPISVKYHQNATGKVVLNTKNVKVIANSSVRDYTLKVVNGTKDNNAFTPNELINRIKELISATDLKAISTNVDANLFIVPFGDNYKAEDISALKEYGTVYYATDGDSAHQPISEYVVEQD